MTTLEVRPLTDAELDKWRASFGWSKPGRVDFPDMLHRKLLATIDADRNALAEARADREALRKFAREIIRDGDEWCVGSDGGTIQDTALMLGLIERADECPPECPNCGGDGSYCSWYTYTRVVTGEVTP